MVIPEKGFFADPFPVPDPDPIRTRSRVRLFDP